MRIILIAALVVVAGAARAADRVALVIGNAAYSQVAALANPVNDARAVSAALERHGFETQTLTDLGKPAMERSLLAFRAKADKANIALVYFAGHGIEVGGKNYLIPVEAALTDERDVAVEAVSLDLVLGQISGAGLMKMVVLDACRNNPFAARMIRAGAGRSVGRGLGKLDTGAPATLVAYAAAAGETTPDGARGGNSPFTAAFVEALAEPPRDVRRLMGSVGDKMRRADPAAQPFVYNSLGGAEYVINPSPPPATAPSAPAFDPYTRDAQLLLSELGYTLREPIGVDGPSTREAIGSFQRANGLAETGRADKTTLAAMRAALKPPIRTTTARPAPAPKAPETPKVRPVIAAPAEPAGAAPEIGKSYVWRHNSLHLALEVEVQPLSGGEAEMTIRFNPESTRWKRFRTCDIPLSGAFRCKLNNMNPHRVEISGALPEARIDVVYGVTNIDEAHRFW